MIIDGIDYSNLPVIASTSFDMKRFFEKNPDNPFIAPGFFSHVQGAMMWSPPKPNKPKTRPLRRAVILKTALGDTDFVEPSLPIPIPPDPASNEKGDRWQTHPNYDIDIAKIQANAKMKHKEYMQRARSSQKAIQNEVNIRITLGDHPQIVRCLGVSPISRGSLVLEYMSNASLKTYQKNNRLDELEMLQLALDVLSALMYLHSKNIIFIDLANDNVLINARMRAKLCDFGGAQQLEAGKTAYIHEHIPGEYGVQAKLSWKAPESNSAPPTSQTYSFSTDLYSFATLVWSLYSHKDPFANHIGNPPLPLHENEADITNTSVRKLALAIWNIDPAQRPHGNHVQQVLQHVFQAEKQVQKIVEQKNNGNEKTLTNSNNCNTEYGTENSKNSRSSRKRRLSESR